MKIKNLLDDKDDNLVSGMGEFTPKNNALPQGASHKTHAEQFQMPIQIYQPWSNMIVKIKIPDSIFKDLLNMYDETMKDWKSFGNQLVGQVEEEPEVSEEMRNKFPQWREFCLSSVAEYVKTATLQTMTGDPVKIL